MDPYPRTARIWQRPSAAAAPCPSRVDWADLYQRAMHVVTYLVYAGVLALFLALFTWPRPEPTERRETHLARMQRENRSLAFKRRGNISEPCRLLLADFADAFADFMACSVKASRPLAVCTRCAQNRYPLERAYKNILSGTGPADADCHLELLDQDDVHVIVYHQRYYEAVVVQNRCDRCVTKLGYGGYKVNEDIVELSRRHDAFRTCVEKNGNRTTADGSPAVCVVCADLLLAQARQLESVSGRKMHPAGAICADVEDMVNVTSRMWRCAGCHAPGEVTGESSWTVHAPVALGVLMVTVFYYALGRRYRNAVALWSRQPGGSVEDREDESEGRDDVDDDGEECEEDEDEELPPYLRPLRAGERLRPPGPGENFSRLVQEVHPEEVRPPALPADARPRRSCCVL